MTAKRFTLKDDGYPTFKKIMRGRHWVGRVCKHANGGYLGVIGKLFVRGATEMEAFNEVCAQSLDYYGSVNEPKVHNPIVSRVNHERRAEPPAVAQELFRGSFKPFDQRLNQEEER